MITSQKYKSKNTNPPETPMGVRERERVSLDDYYIIPYIKPEIPKRMNFGLFAFN